MFACKYRAMAMWPVKSLETLTVIKGYKNKYN